MEMTLKSYLDDKQVSTNIDPIDFFLKVGDKEHRISADKEGNLVFTLINGTDMKVTTSNGYPAIKIFGR